jgi:hypothetical protein
MAVAAIRDKTATYANGFIMLIILAAIGALAVSFLPKRRSNSAAG